jgi:hypothetical protein
MKKANIVLLLVYLLLTSFRKIRIGQNDFTISVAKRERSIKRRWFESV